MSSLSLIEGCGAHLVFGCDADIRKKLSNMKAIQKEWDEIFENTDMFALKKDEIHIRLSEKLGEGAFCSVFPIHVRNGKTKQIDEFLPPFAVKKIRMDLAGNPKILKEAYADLFHEASILRDIQHDNIIKIIGMSDTTAAQKDFFHNHGEIRVHPRVQT